MQKPINVDYRQFFDFEVCFPIYVSEKDSLSDVLLSFAVQGCVPTAIITDKTSEDFIRLKKDIGARAFKKATAIIYIVQLTREALA